MFKCQLTDAWTTSQEPIQYSCISFAIPSILCYCLIWAKFKFGKISQTMCQQHQNGIQKSLAILVLIILFCWVLAWVAKNAIRIIFPYPIPVAYILMSLPNLLISLNGSINIVVLYICRLNH